MRIKWHSVSLWLFLIALGLLGSVYGYLTVRLHTLDQRLAGYRYEVQKRKYAKSARYWVNYELQVRKNEIQSSLANPDSAE